MADNGHALVNRRISTRSSIAPSVTPSMPTFHNDDDFDYESDDSNAAMGISDGFRPSNVAAEPMRMAGHQHQTYPLLNSSEGPSSFPRRSIAPPRPSSTTKPRGIDNFALRHDGQTNHNLPMATQAISSSSSRVSHRSRASSIETIDSFVPRPESPYRGPSAPSHPYQVYNQDTPLTRTASIVTTSTYQPHVERESVYTGPSGPTHPYTLYPQNTVEEPETIVAAPPVIPIGFPGRVDEYQRRLGPEGEEAADLIGPDGHTEQLPPYTQYPDAAFLRKAAAMSAALPLPGLEDQNGSTSRSPVQSSPVNPFETPISRSTSFASQAPPSRQASSMSTLTPENEKAELKPWQLFLKRRVCGIVPIWVLALAGILVIVFATIAGVAVALTRKEHGPPPPGISPTPASAQSQYATTVTTTYDATTLPTAPSGLPALPVGEYWLNIESAQTQSTSCIPNTAEYAAWSCSMALGMLRMNVQSPSSTTGNKISIYETPESSNGGPPDYFYGTQPPTISDAQVMSLVSDTNYKTYGPAWFFQLPYNKLVIVPPGSLAEPTTKRSFVYGNKMYDSVSGYGDPVRRGQAPGVGDTPWFCYWNHTLLETFIYPQVNSSYNAQAASSSSAAAAMATSGTTTSSSNTAAASGSTVLTQFAAPYPKIVRVKERRLPTNEIDPYCVKMQLQQSGWATPYLDANGQQVRIQLNETEQAAVTTNAKRADDMHGSMKRDDGANCNCVWVAS